MKKKLLALLCVLSVLVGVAALSATAATTPAEGQFSAGYAKVDITPYFYDDAGNFTDAAGNVVTEGIIMPVPLRGMGPSAKRLAYEYKANDSGDGTADANDGLFTSCIAVTDSAGSTVLFISVDAIGDMKGFKTDGTSQNGYMTDARTAITAATGIPEDHIFITATHAHGGVDLDVLNDSSVKALKNLETANAVEVVMADKTTTYYVGDNVDTNGDGIITTGDTVNTYLQAWRDRLIANLVKVSEDAIADQEVATVKKGSIEATDASAAATGSAKVMNTVRHYIGTDARNNDQYYVSGDNCNMSPKNTVNSTTGATGTFVDQVSDVDQTLHAVSFTFANSAKKPIVLVNWRCHPSLNSGMTGEANRVLTSDYVNSFRYTMETNGYRASFYQGAGGNNNPTSDVGTEGQWLKNYAKANCGRGNPYGKALAQIVIECLDSSNNYMKAVTTDKIQVLHQVYDGVLRTYEDAEIRAAEAALAASNAGTWTNTNLEPYFYTEGGQVYGIASVNHAKTVIRQAKMTSVKMEINTLLLGSNIAIVTCPGEAFDRYSMEAAAELEELCGHDLNGSTTVAQYTAVANKYNDWDMLLLYNSTSNPDGIRNAKYGEPLIFGYTNQYHNYIPNALAYTYNSVEPETYVVGSYETYLTPLAQGEGERMVANLRDMLDQVVNSQTAPCEHCGGEEVAWFPLNSMSQNSGNDHYYLVGDHNLLTRWNVTEGSICLDLQGQTLKNPYSGSGRAFNVSDGATLNIMDTVGTGQVIGTANAGSGGTIWINPKGTLNIYGGTFSADNTNANAAFGGVLYNQGTVNMYGGKIAGCNANNMGGAICLFESASVLNVYGGEITAGTAAKGGNCIAFRDNDGTVTIGGNAVIDEIYYVNGPTANNFKIVATEDSPAFTGSVGLNANGVTVDNKTVIGSFTAQWTADTEVTISNGAVVALTRDNKLVAQTKINGAAGVVIDGVVTDGMTLEDAIANVGTGYVILGADVETLNISKNITIDLNGKTITNLNVTDGTVKLRDSQTDDYCVGDHAYGVVVNASDNVVAADGYMAITDTTGTSYHCYSMDLKSVTLRPSANGLYYKSEFLGDEKVAALIDSFGVALNLTEEPNETNMKPGTYSAFTNDAFGGENTSTILVNIMKSVNSVATNAANAQKPVYGRAYIKYTNGTYQFTESEYYSLQELTEIISKDYWTTLDATQKDDLVEMYRKFSAVMSKWDIENIKTEYATRVAQQQQEEDETLKMIILGSSYSIDSYHLLGEVINAEGIPDGFTYNGNLIKNVELGIMYKSGCHMYEHASNAKKDNAAYTYYKTSYQSDATYTSGWTSQSKTTLKEALTDEKWDIVVLQESNMDEAVAYDYHTSDTQYVVNYVKRTLGYTPAFKWNLTWANPEVPNCDGVAGEDEWIYEIANPGAESFENRMNAFYGNDAQTQHNKMVSYVQKYINGHYGITEDNIVACGTAVMYALNKLTLSGDTYDYVANEKFTYRDYCHLSDVSRVMVSYLWYAELFGLDEIDADGNGLAYTIIPAAMRAYDKTANVVLTETMQDNIIKAVNYTLANRFGQYTGQ